MWVVTITKKEKLEANEARYNQDTVYSQLFEELDVQRLVYILNKPQSVLDNEIKIGAPE